MVKIFVLEPMAEKWKPIFEELNTSDHYDGHLNNLGYWYINRDKQEAIFCIQSVSSFIVRCDPGQDYYSFVFIVKDIGIHIWVDFYSLPPYYERQWHEKNRMHVEKLSAVDTKITIKEPISDIYKAISFYISQLHEKRKMIFENFSATGLTEEELIKDAKEAILFHLNNSSADARKLEKQM